MRASHLLQLFTTLLGASLLTTASAGAALEDDIESVDAFRPRLQCKCLPSKPCWPSSSMWSAFNQTVGGRLIATMPVARECHPPYENKAKCDQVREGYFYELWRQHQPGAVLQANWETFHGAGCLLDQTGPCQQGAVPLFTVNASNIDDVRATIRFASQNNVRLVVKNTGHDYLGRSTAVSSLSLWTFFMKKIQVTDKFVPEGAPHGTKGTDAIILEAGVQWKDAYDTADKYGRIVVGGAHPTVGASGAFCQSGGHGPLSPLHGLCVDNVLQYKVVTADGELRIANAYQHQDLFWALRGGGPSYGVVVEAIYRTHPAVKNINFAVAAVISNDTDKIEKAIQVFYAHQPRLSNDGWAGYATIRRTFLGMSYHLPDNTLDGAKASFQPLLDAMRAISGVQVNNVTFLQFSSYADYREAMVPVTPMQNAGVNVILSSRLIPRSLLESQQGPARLTTAMSQILGDMEGFSNEYLSMLVAGGQVAKGDIQATSVHPAWRKSLLTIAAYAYWSDSTPFAEQQEIQLGLTRSFDRLRRITPGGGTYLNEADPNEPNFQLAFFGPNYLRLKTIKNKYDPQGLFICRRCVGSEDWDTDEICPRRR